MTEKKLLSPKPITQKRLMNIALYYLGRYETSSSRLKSFLLRRIAKERLKGADIPDNAEDLVCDVVNKVCSDGYVDDARYADTLVRRLTSSGKSQKAIREKMRQNGIPEEVQKEVLSRYLENADDAELEAALRLVRKKRLGFCRPEELRREFRKKDLAVLARAGFSFQTALKALGESDSEEDYEY